MSQNQFFGRRDKNKFCKRRQFLHREREREIVSVCDREMERERETVWPVKSCQMSIKVDQKWFHKKN